MKGRKHTPEQIVRKLREADRMTAEGATVAEAAKALEISEHTFYRWRTAYGGMSAEDVKELRRLREENRRLKQMVADRDLDIEMLKEVARGNF
jgi:putative transposase